LGRRQFLTDLGRNAFAIAVLGGVVAACSGDDDAGQEPASTTTPNEPAQVSTTSDVVADDPMLRWAQVSLGFVSAYVLVRGNEAAVVDTGSPGSAGEIEAALATLNATFDDVRHVVLTHSHPDHVGSLPTVLDRSAGAAAYAGADDIANISAPVDVTAVGDGDDVFGLEVISTPGHTPGSISVFDPGIGLLVAGDALNGNADGTELSGANEQFTANMGTANESVRKLAALDVDAVAMGHGQPVRSGAGALLSDLAVGL
jgi:glyoxylase-like metal-dependent hydrolase (beta-lactamase superfamily II)